MRAFIAHRLVRLASVCWLLILCNLLTGCLLPRKLSALSQSAQPGEMTALLPAETSADYGKNLISREKALRLANRVLDTLADSKKGLLIGPLKVSSLIGSNGVPSVLRWETPAKDLGSDPAGSAAASQIARQLGVKRVVRCWVNVPTLSVSAGGLGGELTGYSSVRLELISLDPLALVEASNGNGECSQMMGLWWFGPFYFGSTYGRAVDKAERSALELLFKRARTK